MTLTKIKKRIVVLSVIITGLLTLEVIKRKYFVNNLDIGGIVVDSIYKLPGSEIQLGELRSFEVEFDSIREDRLFFRIGIQGINGDTSLKGEILKNDGTCKLLKLSKQ